MNTIKKFLVDLTDKANQYLYLLEKKTSTCIKSKKYLFKFLFNFLDLASKYISFILGYRFMYLIFCTLLFILPIIYETNLFSYYNYINENGASILNILYGSFKFFSLPLLFVFYLFLLTSVIVFLITPLLYISCLTDALKLKYGDNVLKQRSCNSTSGPLKKIIVAAACLICGQDQAARVMAHKMSTEAWVEVNKFNTGEPVPQPIYTGTLDLPAKVINSLVDLVKKK